MRELREWFMACARLRRTDARLVLLVPRAGHVWSLLGGPGLGLHGVFRFRQSQDETVSIVYDPRGFQLGLMLSVGIDGEPLLGP